jgi:hypothetical protein
VCLALLRGAAEHLAEGAGELVHVERAGEKSSTPESKARLQLAVVAMIITQGSPRSAGGGWSSTVKLVAVPLKSSTTACTEARCSPTRWRPRAVRPGDGAVGCHPAQQLTASSSSLTTRTPKVVAPVSAPAWLVQSSTVQQRGRPSFAGFEGFQQVHGDVGDLQVLVLEALALHPIVDHDVAERAGGGDTPGPVAMSSCELDVDLLADALLHPHARPAGAAAHALGAVAFGLGDLDAGQRTDHLAGGQVHVVVATEVAGVVVDDALIERASLMSSLPVSISHSRNWLWWTTS